MIEFYKNVSKYRSHACLQCCYHYKMTPNRKEFVEFLKSHETRLHVNASFISFLLNVIKCFMIIEVIQFSFYFIGLKGLRCRYVISKKEDNCIRFCFPCSMKFGNSNKCFLCNGRFTVKDKYVYKCMRHSSRDFSAPGTYKCCICKITCLYDYKNTILSPVKAKLCQSCNSDVCCKFDFED